MAEEKRVIKYVGMDALKRVVEWLVGPGVIDVDKLGEDAEEETENGSDSSDA